MSNALQRGANVTKITKSYLLPSDRGLIAVGGVDANNFLQDLITNDIDKATRARAIYAALLTPQGKYLFDFIVARVGADLMLDCEASRRDDLIKRLSMYRLRAKVTIEPAAGLAVAVLYGDGTLDAIGLGPESGAGREFAGGIAFVDPRLPALGARAILPAKGAAEAIEALGLVAGAPGDYEALRLGLGVPDGSRDLEIERSALLESGFDELNGIDWDKGCFVGQELTARTRYRGLVKRRLVAVAVDGPLPEPGTPIEQDGNVAGAVRSGQDGIALALLRLDAVERFEADGAPLTAGNATLVPQVPKSAFFFQTAVSTAHRCLASAPFDKLRSAPELTRGSQAGGRPRPALEGKRKRLFLKQSRCPSGP